MANKMDQFSFRLVALDSVLRQAKFAADEAVLAIKELKHDNFKKGKEKTIQLFRTLQKLTLEYQYLRGSFDEEKSEKYLEMLMNSIQKEVIIFLARYQRNNNIWQFVKVIPLLVKISGLGKKVEEILLVLSERTPKKGDYFFVGLDGGGTSCKAIVADSSGKIIGKGKAGLCSPKRIGVIKSFAHIFEAIKNAVHDAGLEFSTTYFKRICIGVGGIGNTYTHKRLNSLFWGYTKKLKNKALNIESAVVINDSVLAWYSSFGGEPGIIVIGGTHDLVYGYNKGLEANRDIKDFSNWREKIRLSARVISWHAAQSLLKVIKHKRKRTILYNEWINAFKNGEIFSRHKGESFEKVLVSIEPEMKSNGLLNITTTEAADATRFVFAAAQKGDKEAIRIIYGGINTATTTVASVAEQIGLHNQPFKVAIIGSTVRNIFAKRKLENELKEIEPYAEVISPKFEPEIGAIDIAIKDIRFY